MDLVRVKWRSMNELIILRWENETFCPKQISCINGLVTRSPQEDVSSKINDVEVSRRRSVV